MMTEIEKAKTKKFNWSMILKANKTLTKKQRK
jgi:hypothetical protein